MICIISFLRETLPLFAFLSLYAYISLPVLAIEMGDSYYSKVNYKILNDREEWIRVLTKIIRPVLVNFASGTLNKNMPCESISSKKYKEVQNLEAIGRTLNGIAPWLELGGDSHTEEGKIRAYFLDLVLTGLSKTATKQGEINFYLTSNKQPLVDAAFLAQSFLRAPTQIWGKLDENVKQYYIEQFKRTRRIQPGGNNWLLFTAMIETFILEVCPSNFTEIYLYPHIKTFQENFYKGDSIYSDGIFIQTDYYNSYVIVPFLVDIHKILLKHQKTTPKEYSTLVQRLTRLAVILERLISPEGTFPVIGRSLTYRNGNLHALGMATLMNQIPKYVKKCQIRSAMTKVIERQFQSEKNFDENGWLTVGFAGSQLTMGEEYVRTGSLYLCAFGFLPLGLPENDDFWIQPRCNWTSLNAWNGIDVGKDHNIN